MTTGPPQLPVPVTLSRAGRGVRVGVETVGGPDDGLGLASGRTVVTTLGGTGVLAHPATRSKAATTRSMWAMATNDRAAE
jgi:hypothetical protein